MAKEKFKELLKHTSPRNPCNRDEIDAAVEGMHKLLWEMIHQTQPGRPDVVANTFDDKIKTLKKRIFPPHPEADLSDRGGYIYLPSTGYLVVITKKEVSQTIKRRRRRQGTRVRWNNKKSATSTYYRVENTPDADVSSLRW